MRRLLPTLAVCAALSLGACGEDGENGGSGPVPDGAAAKLGDATVTQTALRQRVEALRQASAAPEGESSAGSGSDDDAALESQALGQLLLAAWIEQEADRRGVSVQRADVRRRWAAAVADQFDSKRALRRFLGGRSVADVVDDLRRQELLERIYRQIRDEAPPGEGQTAVAQFKRQLNTAWRQDASCDSRYADAVCGD